MSKPDASTSLRESYRHRWTLFVGVNQYVDAAFSNLSVCASDIQSVYDFLIANGYAPDRARLLLSPGKHEHLATRAEILSACFQEQSHSPSLSNAC